MDAGNLIDHPERMRLLGELHVVSMQEKGNCRDIIKIQFRQWQLRVEIVIRLLYLRSDLYCLDAFNMHATKSACSPPL